MSRTYKVSRKTIYAWNSKDQQDLELYESIKDFVLQVRKHLPRLGGRKLYFMLKTELEENNIKIGRDKFFKVLKDLRLLFVA